MNSISSNNSSSNGDNKPAHHKDYWAAPLSTNGENTFVLPSVILENYINVLTEFEISEIQNYKTIYFTGRRDHKLSSHSITDFEGEDGLYIGYAGDHIAYRYEICDVQGVGTYSQVYRCYDYKSRRYVAIKVIRKGELYFQQGMNEVNIMRLIYEADPDSTHCINHFLNSFIFRDHLCIVTPLLGKNLFSMLEDRDYRGLDIASVQFICKQILISLCLLKQLTLVHCDLKPENILLVPKQKTLPYVKTVDLGSCQHPSNNLVQTYIQSRFYRAPEIILGIPFSYGIDMWSLGCILYELYTGYPLFQGESERDQMVLYINTLGVPPRDLLNASTRKNEFFAGSTPFMTLKSGQSLNVAPCNLIRQRINTAPIEFQDFVYLCLQWKPKDRITCDEAFNHAFLLVKYNPSP